MLPELWVWFLPSSPLPGRSPALPCLFHPGKASCSALQVSMCSGRHQLLSAVGIAPGIQEAVLDAQDIQRCALITLTEQGN